jgi:retinol dehydrogenase 12
MDDQAGRTFLVTGANTGIGRVTAVELARRGGHVVLGCRSPTKGQPVVDSIRAAGGSAELLEVDLASFASIRSAAKNLLAREPKLDVLVNNAGLAARGSTNDGFELTFGTNHLGTFLLTLLLLPRLRESGAARIVTVASGAHHHARTIDFDAVRQPTRTITCIREYDRSKLANVLFTRSLAKGRAGAGVRSYALHPGVVATDAWRRIPRPIRWWMMRRMLTPEQGALTTLYCATSDEVQEHDGRYYDECRERQPSKLALDDSLADELWRRSEELVGERLP